MFPSFRAIFAHFNPRSLAGATTITVGKVFTALISIHAPSRERRVRVNGLCVVCIFQSTLPRGSDDKIVLFSLTLKISIHAPSRERPSHNITNFLLHAFQSTLPRGSDKSGILPTYTTIQFQSTLPRGSDRMGLRPAFLRSYFNPRSLAGATLRSRRLIYHDLISIHAPSRERQITFKLFLPMLQFQSTLPRGSDRFRLCNH